MNDWDLRGKMSHGTYKLEIMLDYGDRLNYHGTLKGVFGMLEWKG